MYGLVIVLIIMALLSASMDVLANRFRGSWFDKCGFNRNFWDLRMSYGNIKMLNKKYPKIPSMVLVCFADGWHFFKFLYNCLLAFLVAYVSGTGFWGFVFVYLVYTISFESLYNALK